MKMDRRQENVNLFELLQKRIVVEEEQWGSAVQYMRAQQDQEQPYDVMKRIIYAVIRQHMRDVNTLYRSVCCIDESTIWTIEEQYTWQQLLEELKHRVASIVILQSEKDVQCVNIEDLMERVVLIEELEQQPLEMFSRLRYLQPQIGCFNRCSFCSQSAGTTIWYLNERGLQNLFSALKTVSLQKAQQYVLEHGELYMQQPPVVTKQQTLSADFCMPIAGLVGYGRTSHRPGVIFCYLDNDISSYPYLHQYVQYAYEDLGVKVRISTVGYSRKNAALQAMHEMIATKHVNKIAGVRLSLTSYTTSWYEKRNHFETCQQDFAADIANFLRTYKPVIDEIGTGQRTGCVEFRFKPLLETRLAFHEYITPTMHIIHVGPYILHREHPIPLQTCSMRVDEQTLALIIDGQGQSYKLYVSDQFRLLTEHTVVDALKQLPSNIATRNITLYKVENEDGPYYVADPLMTNEGVFTKHFYPATSKRPYAGYIDSERYFLNSLLAYKRKCNIIGRQQPFPQSTWEDINETLAQLEDTAYDLQCYNERAGQYILSEIMPLVSMYVAALKEAHYAASYFYLSTFTIDTGSICNLGQAYFEFQDLASRRNLPLTPQQERSYGASSSLSVEGEKWRISVTPHGPTTLRKKSVGHRNELVVSPSMIIERENLAVRTLHGEEGVADYQKIISMQHIEQMTLKEGIDQKVLIGQV